MVLKCLQCGNESLLSLHYAYGNTHYKKGVIAPLYGAPKEDLAEMGFLQFHLCDLCSLITANCVTYSRATCPPLLPLSGKHLEDPAMDSVLAGPSAIYPSARTSLKPISVL